MKWQHIVPVNDLKPHSNDWPKTEEICDCIPAIDWEHKLVVHNAWDCREAVEEANSILEKAAKPEITRTNEPETSESFCDCGKLGRCSKYCICKCHHVEARRK